jgi:hypothetical protein
MGHPARLGLHPADGTGPLPVGPWSLGDGGGLLEGTGAASAGRRSRPRLFEVPLPRKSDRIITFAGPAPSR